MRVIGITGGIGCGKSTVLDILFEECNCAIYKADDIANSLKDKGGPCYEKIVEILGEGVLDPDGEINKRMMAISIFSDVEKKKAVEDVIFPAVKEYITDKIAMHKEKNDIDYMFIEAALLIEDGYESICEEIWYVYASVANRTKRLMTNRGYSLQRVEAIMDSQLRDSEYRKHCQKVIDNDSDENTARESIRKVLGK